LLGGGTSIRENRNGHRLKQEAVVGMKNRNARKKRVTRCSEINRFKKRVHLSAFLRQIEEDKRKRRFFSILRGINDRIMAMGNDETVWAWGEARKGRTTNSNPHPKERKKGRRRKASTWVRQSTD